MGTKKRGHRGHGVRDRALVERERRLVRKKETQVRAAVHRLRVLTREGENASETELDELFLEVRRLAVSPRGLVSDAFRKELWPFLLGDIEAATHEDRNEPFPVKNGLKTVHRDTEQVEKDVERSLYHYDVVHGLKESERRAKRRALTQIIMAVLDSNAELFYFQGYHDIVSVFLLAMGNSPSTVHAVRHVSETYQREPMRSGFESVMTTIRLLFPLLDSADEVLFQHLHESAVEPFFVLPWMITWFAHQLKRFKDVTRLYDLFLVSHPLFSIYVSASVVLEARTKILRCERDFGTMHGLLSNLPSTMNIEKVVARAMMLFHQLPPEQLLQQSQLDISTLRSTTYFQFPFKYQRWSSVNTPMIENVPSLPPRRSRDADKVNFLLRSWQTSIVATAVAVGVVAVVSAYVFRDRLAMKA